jgi:hypothetical protein
MITTSPISLPRASRGVIQAVARELIDNDREPRAVLVRAAPVWDGEDTITVGDDGTAVTVAIRPAATVLEVLDLLEAPGDGLLIIPTALSEADLGPSLRSQVAFNKIKSIDPWEGIRDASRADRIDQRLRGKDSRWIADQLLMYGDELWKRRSQPPRILTRSDVLRRILGIRLHGNPDEVIDVATMLSWSQQATNLAKWRELPSELRTHLSEALREVAGRAAAIVTALADSGEGHDTLAVAIVATALGTTAEKAAIPLARFEQRYFGNDHPDPEALQKFADAGRAHLFRVSDDDPETATAVYRRAETILGELGGGDIIAESEWFTAGFDHRLTAFAAVVRKAVGKPEKLDKAEQAREQLKKHQLAGNHSGHIQVATDAIRLLRWLAGPEPEAVTVSEWVDWQIREGGWVDAACARVRVADTERYPPLRQAYQSVIAHVRDRRSTADRRFAERLREWRAGQTDRLLLAENLQERIMRPLAGAKDREAAPLLIVCDGMSAADATAIGADIAASGGWVEVGRNPESREGALATLPSSTVYSRASLLSGRLICGGQDVERQGLAAFWGRRDTKLFHKGDLRTVQAGRIPDELQYALAERRTIVAVVLNTIDDALDKDDLVSRPAWSVSSIDYLAPLLEAASRASRPVVICSDHGHIRESGDSVKSDTAGESARWRVGTRPVEGEIEVSGPRVLIDDRLIAAVDENIRYRPKKAGYHGGASLAEMVIPVQIYVPSAKARAEHWVVYESATDHEPIWWNNRIPAPTAPPKPAEAAATLFTDSTLGQRLSESETYRAQVTGARRPPNPNQVAAIIDAAQAAGGVLASAHVARLAQRPTTSIGGYITNLQRILNLDGTQVLSKQDNGASVRFNLGLMAEQFLGGRQ